MIIKNRPTNIGPILFRIAMLIMQTFFTVIYCKFDWQGSILFEQFKNRFGYPLIGGPERFPTLRGRNIFDIIITC